MNSAEETKGMMVALILQVIGRPPKHLIESLEKMISDIGEETGVDVKNKEIKKPTPMKDQKGLYTTFAEVEVAVEEILYLIRLLFKYMPAHVEIISPELLTLNNNGWNEALNELMGRLHGYDEVARITQVEKDILEKKLKETTEKKE